MNLIVGLSAAAVILLIGFLVERIVTYRRVINHLEIVNQLWADSHDRQHLTSSRLHSEEINHRRGLHLALGMAKHTIRLLTKKLSDQNDEAVPLFEHEPDIEYINDDCSDIERLFSESCEKRDL